MAGSTVLTKTLDNISAIAAAFTPIGANTIQGYRRFADSENFEATIATLTPYTQAYWSAWLKKATVAENEVFPAKIIGELAINVPKDVSTDMNACWDLAFNFATALSADANWPVGTCKPFRVDFSLYSIDIVKRNGIALFDFGAYGDGGIEFPDP